MVRSGRGALCSVLLVLIVAGCSATVHGSGGTSATGGTSTKASTTAGPSATPKSGPSSSAGQFPRTPFSTAIGDPATADVCAVIPAKSFAVLHGYTAVADSETFPPGCSVRIKKGTVVAFSVLAYGVASDSFSHLGPPHVGKVARTGKLDGVGVNYYAYAATPIGDCARDVLADGVTFKVDVLGSSDDAKSARNRTLHCDAADVMTKDLAAAVAARHVPRLKLATASLTRIDFCAALRATKISDVDDFAATVPTIDGVGDGCQLTRGSSFSFYLDFEIQPGAVPQLSKAVMVGGHHLYAETGNDQRSFCSFTSVQGHTPDGRYEAVTASSNDTGSGSRAPKQLCTETATVTARFLDAAGLR